VSDIADRLGAAKDALQYCADAHPASGIIQRALANFPDTDAMGLCVKAVRRFRHSFIYPIISDGEALDAALAKLEEKP